MITRFIITCVNKWLELVDKTTSKSLAISNDSRGWPISSKLWAERCGDKIILTGAEQFGSPMGGNVNYSIYTVAFD